MYQSLSPITQRLTRALVVLFAMLFASTPVMAEALKKDDAPKFTRMVAEYPTPDVTVVRNDGQKLPFIKELDDGRPVIMNFIFASCSAICPMLSHVFSKVQSKLEKDHQIAHMMSISIDPENDTPAKLNEYAKKFGVSSNWDYYTGNVETSIAIQKAFDAYRGDKMNHTSLILLRAAPGKQWIRLEGFVSPDEVVKEFHSLTKQ